MTDHYEEILDALSHEIWAAAQLAPGEGIVDDGVARIVALLRREAHPAITHCVTVRYDLSPAQTESAIRDALIRMGWTPPDEHALSQPAEQRAEIEALREVLKDADNELDWLDEDMDTCDHSVRVCMCSYCTGACGGR